MNKHIAIIGLGWLGKALATFLLQQSYTILGSTTTPSKIPLLEALGIQPYCIDLDQQGQEIALEQMLSKAATVVICIPPRHQKKSDYSYAQKMTRIANAINDSNKNILFISSTSVYAGTSGILSKTNIEKPKSTRSHAIWEAEEVWRNRFKNTSILRFSGLIGSNRHPIYTLAGRKKIPNGNWPINLIHQKDCIGIIYRILEDQIWGKTYHAAYPFHPQKATYYIQKAHQLGLEAPEFESNPLPGKIIDSSKLIRELSYTFAEKI
ncbi:MAG: NAD(P)-binding domain-containing protein [Flavobacteriaceae bacterium]|nr:NAD(P)-binding domain-containing protein [Flavobacteriaceae bacterium]